MRLLRKVDMITDEVFSKIQCQLKEREATTTGFHLCGLGQFEYFE
jgi:hypothetical protein